MIDEKRRLGKEEKIENGGEQEMKWKDGGAKIEVNGNVI
jgi:hypothetical protein